MIVLVMFMKLNEILKKEDKRKIKRYCFILALLHYIDFKQTKIILSVPYFYEINTLIKDFDSLLIIKIIGVVISCLLGCVFYIGINELRNEYKNHRLINLFLVNDLLFLILIGYTWAVVLHNHLLFIEMNKMYYEIYNLYFEYNLIIFITIILTFLFSD